MSSNKLKLRPELMSGGAVAMVSTTETHMSSCMWYKECIMVTRCFWSHSLPPPFFFSFLMPSVLILFWVDHTKNPGDTSLRKCVNNHPHTPVHEDQIVNDVNNRFCFCKRGFNKRFTVILFSFPWLICNLYYRKCHSNKLNSKPVLVSFSVRGPLEATFNRM